MTDSRIAANRTLGAHFFAEQDRLRGGPARDLCADNYTVELGGNPAMPFAGHEQFALAFYAGFPDLRHEIIDVIATEDTATVRFVLHATHEGSFFGIPASHRQVRVTANVIMYIEHGRVRRLQGVFDEAGMLRQIGVLPS